MWCILRRIPRSKIALNKSQFDAIHTHISRSLCGTGKQVSGIVETHSECAEQVMPRSCVSEAGVAGVSSPVQTCPATTDTITITSHSGVHCYILISLRYCPNCCIMRVLP